MALLMWLLMPSAWAGPGHDHGDEPTAAASTSPTAAPRVTSHSDLFELVGVVGQGEMTIYLDHYASNAPVTGAKIDVEVGTVKGVATAQADGTHVFKNDIFNTPGDLAVSFTVQAGQDTDLLAGDLTIGSGHAAQAAHAHDAASRPWLRWLGLAGGAALLMAAVFVFRKRKAGAAYRSTTAVLAAACALLASAAMPNNALAGPGHDHGDEAAPVANGNAPKRQLDGSVYLPKPSQRQLLIRTERVEEQLLAKSIELTGRVVLDANAGGKVQPTQAGRIEAGPRGLPTLGQTVRKGDLLAVVRASTTAIERANQQSQTSELRSNLELAKKRVARLEQLGAWAAEDIEAKIGPSEGSF